MLQGTTFNMDNESCDVRTEMGKMRDKITAFVVQGPVSYRAAGAKVE